MKYNNFVFWWKTDSDRYGSSFLRWWRFRRAYKEGAVDFYMSTIMIVGGLTILIGLVKGYRKGGSTYYQEKVNEIKLKELDLEIERIKILMELNMVEH